MTIKLRVTVSMSAVAAMLLVTGCSPGDLIDKAVEGAVEKGVESATGAKIDVDEDGGQISFKGEDGEVSFGTDTQIPNGFPDEVPLIDGELFSSMKMSDGGVDSFSVNFNVPGDMSALFSEAADLLTSAGFTEDTSLDMGEMRNATYTGTGAVAGVVLSAMQDADEGTVMVGYQVYMAEDE